MSRGVAKALKILSRKRILEKTPEKREEWESPFRVRKQGRP